MNSKLFDQEGFGGKRNLLSYAYLAQASKAEGDLISGVASIFKPIAKMKAGEIFDIEEFCRLVDELYGLKIHPWAVEDLIPRLEHNELLIRHNVSEKIEEVLYAEISEEFTEIAESDIRHLTDQFVDFCRPILTQNNLSFDEVELAEDFLEHLTDLNFISVTLSPDSTNSSPRSENTLTLGRHGKKEENNGYEGYLAFKDKSRLNTLCASFVLSAYNLNPDLYELIVKLVSGAIVAEVVLNFQAPGVDANLSQVTFVIDTPLLMAVMDLTSEKEHEFAESLIEDMREKGSSLAVYQHSFDELQDNLRAVKKLHKEKISFGETARRLRQPGFTAYFEQVVSDPEVLLRQLGIRILPDISSSTSQELFSDEDEVSLFSTLGSFKNQKAQERDASSISQTIRHRNGMKTNQKDFYKCRYIFITENSFIADKAMEYMVKNGILNSKHFPPAVSSRYISGLLWVLFGGKGLELSRHLLLANCTKALTPNNDLVQRMQTFLGEMSPIQSELFEGVMGEERAGQYLMQYSLGDATLVTNENAISILEKLKESLFEKHEVAMAEKISDLKRKHDEEKAREVSEIEGRFKNQLGQRDQSIEETNAKLYQADETVAIQSSKIEKLESGLKTVLGEIEANKRQARDEKVRKIERVMVSAVSAQKRFEILIALLFFSCIFVLSIYLSNPIPDLGIRFSLIAAASFLSTFGFWYIPNVVFGYLSKKYRDFIFNKLLMQKDLQVDLDHIHYDWESVKLNLLEEEHEISGGGD